MEHLRWIAAALIAHLLLPAALLAEGWSLNPLAKKNSHPAHVRLAEEEKSPWWKPKMPSLSRNGSRKSSQPSTWTKLSRGTKSAWSKTTDALNPFDDESDKPKPVTGYNTAFSRSSRKPAKKSSWWSFGADEEPQRPKTVQDFLGQPMPY